MIVNPQRDGWEIIYHRAHALLAAQFALAWDNPKQVLRIPETIAAIAQHDDLEREFHGDHLSPQGAPLDFTLMPGSLDDTTSWEQLMEDALYRSRWVAVLTAMHIAFLHAPSHGQSRTLDAFLGGLERQRRVWLKALGVTLKQAYAAYAFMQWCDRISLICCNHELPDRERWLEVGVGPDGRRYDRAAARRPDGRGHAVAVRHRSVHRHHRYRAPRPAGVHRQG